MSDNFPLPNDRIADGVVVASVHYNEELSLATILVLRPEAPYFRVGVWNFKDHQWDGYNHFYDHFNIVDAIRGEDSEALGYEQLGGDR